MKSNLGQVVTSHGHCQTRNFIIQIDHLSICCILEKSLTGFEFFRFLLYLSKHCVMGKVSVLALETSALTRDSGSASPTREVKDHLKETLAAVKAE